MKESKKISDYLDISFLQMLQDNCSKAMGLAFVTVDYRGCPITHYSGFTPYCQLGRKQQGFFEMCKQCDAHGGLQAAITGEPYIYRCHAGLVDFALPLICDGIYMGSLMGGQIRLNREEKGELERILPVETDWRKDKALDEAYNETQMVSYEKVKSAVTLLHDVILLMMQNGEQTGQALEKVGMNSIDWKPASNIEFSFQRNELADVKHQGKLRYFFFVMNIISQLAFQEKAAKTEAVAYDFADVMRYVTETDHEISTLGEELNYVNALLRIQKAWMGEALCFHISVPKEYWGINCPYMVLEPLIGLAVQGCEAGEAHEIEILAGEEQEDLVIQVVSDNEKMMLEELNAKLSGSFQEEGFSLRDSDRGLKRIFGKQYGISVGSRADGQTGYMICFRLPQKKG
ncbi:MAG: histidine kinase [Lachnospiraceae bacterium]|nr:histidine kinase [Lachnospiraceae bacterium]